MQGEEDRDLGQEVGHLKDEGGVEVGHHVDHTIGMQHTFNFVFIRNHCCKVKNTSSLLHNRVDKRNTKAMFSKL